MWITTEDQLYWQNSRTTISALAKTIKAYFHLLHLLLKKQSRSLAVMVTYFYRVSFWH